MTGVVERRASIQVTDPTANNKQISRRGLLFVRVQGQLSADSNLSMDSCVAICIQGPTPPMTEPPNLEPLGQNGLLTFEGEVTAPATGQNLIVFAKAQFSESGMNPFSVTAVSEVFSIP